MSDADALRSLKFEKQLKSNVARVQDSTLHLRTPGKREFGKQFHTLRLKSIVLCDTA